MCDLTASGNRLEIQGMNPLAGIFLDFPLPGRVAGMGRKYTPLGRDSARIVFHLVLRGRRCSPLSRDFPPAARWGRSEGTASAAQASPVPVSVARASAVRIFQIRCLDRV